jgi:hypothetical protein
VHKNSGVSWTPLTHPVLLLQLSMSPGGKPLPKGPIKPVQSRTNNSRPQNHRSKLNEVKALSAKQRRFTLNDRRSSAFPRSAIDGAYGLSHHLFDRIPGLRYRADLL